MSESIGGSTIDASPGDDGLERAIRARLRSVNSGNYRKNNESVLRVFANFLRVERGVTSVDEISVIDCRRYAQWLGDVVAGDLSRWNASTDRELSAASASRRGAYFAIPRAWLSWCVDDELIDSNPARPSRVKDELPTDTERPDRQYWHREDRDAILRYVDERAHEALTAEDGDGPELAFRDRALVATLALTGVRGAEVFSDPAEPRRTGLAWADVDLETGVAEVLGKSFERETVSLVDDVVTALDRLRRVQDPPTDDWPVFPTAHRPTLARVVRERLAATGVDAEAELDDRGVDEALREYEIVPPALSKNGARSVMKRLCESAGVHVDGEYLKPHGGRRGLGHQLYDASAELSQEVLRHRSIETTHRSYREARAEERRERIDEALDR